jgi:hypothetical protein
MSKWSRDAISSSFSSIVLADCFALFGSMPRNGWLYTTVALLARTPRIVRCQNADPRCPEQVPGFSEHIDQLFGFEKPLSLRKFLAVSASWQEHPRPEFTKQLESPLHFHFLFSF